MVELRTDRLALRRFLPADVDDALAYRDDPAFAHFLPHIPQPFTRRDAEAFVATNLADPHTFAVVRDERVVGTVNIEVDGRIAMLGYAIGRAQWGRGIAVEAARAVVDWAFPAHDLVRMWASTDARHVRSRRVMEKLGMRYERSEARDGRADEVYYGMSRDAWLTSRPSPARPATP